MTKAQLVKKISEKTGIQQVDTLAVVESFMSEVKESLIAGENVYLRGFGSYFLKKKAQKPGRIIKRNITITIPAHYVPAFKPVKSFVRKVKENNKI
ncbi:MAG: integration host factor subunit beta [Bacteroidetes bacterium]|nr:integration host factor subunit beta [Bacteroidota bacterium]